MPGLQTATLEGWAIRSQGMPGDHTYVISSCGLRWGCWGRSSGGTRLGAGTGSSIIADCLSQPNSTAGIRYGFTGVCHQTSNRILHPASPLSVAGCRNYAVSAFMYGPYGKGTWPERFMCYAIGMNNAQSDVNEPQQSDNMTTKDAYDRVISSSHVTSDGGRASPIAELSALVELGLGNQLDEKTFYALLKIKINLDTHQEALTVLFDQGRITQEVYLQQVNLELQSSMDQSHRLLGEDRFLAIFGTAGLEPQCLIDRDTFLSHAQPKSEQA